MQRHFFVELGYMQPITSRFGALAVMAPPLHEVGGASMSYISSRIGYRRNMLTFEFRTASDVPVAQETLLTFGRVSVAFVGQFMTCAG